MLFNLFCDLCSNQKVFCQEVCADVFTLNCGGYTELATLTGLAGEG